MISHDAGQNDVPIELCESFHPISLSVPSPGVESVSAVVTMADLFELSESVPPPRVELEPTTTRPRPLKGAVFAGARLDYEIRRTARVVSWAARDGKGKPVAVHLPCSYVVGAELEAFMDNAQRLDKLSRDDRVPGVAAVLSLAKDRHAFATPLFEIGTMRDLPVLGWPIDRLTAFFRTLVGTVGEMHARGLFVGSLSPDDVLVDDDLEPVLMWVGASSSVPSRISAVDAKHVAPELSFGETAGELTDVHTLGRLLEMLVSDWLATTTDDVSVRIRSLIARSTAVIPSLRFSSLADLIAELDVATKSASTIGLDLRGPVRPRPRTLPMPVKVPAALAVPRSGRNRLASFYVVEEESSDRPLRAGWLGVGLAGLAAISGVAFAVAVPHSLTGAVSYAGPAFGAVTAAALPTPASLRRAGRPLFALVAALFLFWLDPTTLLAETAKDRRIHSANPSARLAEIQRVIDQPRADLGGLDLTGLDLRGKTIVEADLRGAVLREADLTGATIQASDVAEADMTGAILDGATLTGLDVVATTGFGAAHCSDATSLPSGWVCRDAHPRPGDANEVEEGVREPKANP